MMKITNISKEIRLHHKNMVPYAAYYVIEGMLELIGTSGKRITVGPGEVIGIEEVWNHSPLPYDINAAPKTVLLNLDRSMLSRLKSALKSALK